MDINDQPCPIGLARVMDACGQNCRRTYAINLLKCGNDPDQAIALHNETAASVPGLGLSHHNPFTDTDSDVSSRRSSSTDQDSLADGKRLPPSSPASPEAADTPEPPEWDFVLPTIAFAASLPSEGPFSLDAAVGAVAAGVPTADIHNYLSVHDADGKGLAHLLNGASVCGFPAFFYVVATRRHDLVRIWAKYGGDLNATAGPNKVPLLAFAIGIGGSYLHDTRVVVATLLSLGAHVGTIPTAYYKPLARDLPESGPDADELARDLNEDRTSWVRSEFARRKITAALNFAFTTRAHLHLAALLQQRSGAERQVARMRNSTELLGIPFFLIGQVPASMTLIDRMLAYLAMPSKRPIVFMFAGPSGHGKTEISQQLGSLLSLDFQMVDCTTIKNEVSVFVWTQAIVIKQENVGLAEKLARQVRKESVEKFGAPITGRITQFLPFLTFSPCEAACVADKYLAEFGHEVRRDISLSKNHESLDIIVGNVDMRIRRGYSVCHSLAAEGYSEDLGARSVICEVDSQVKFSMIGAYLKCLSEIREDQGWREYLVDVNVDKDVEVTHVAGGRGGAEEENKE